jgi:hypothetical protein
MDVKKELLDELKKRGLNVAEDALAEVVEAILDTVQKYVVASENKYDDLLVAVLPSAKSLILEQLDKLDGEDDQRA